MEDKDVGDFEASSEVWTEEEIEEMQKNKTPKLTSIMLTVFVGVIIIMIGGLAAYYYYNFQTQGSSYEKRLQDSWDEVSISTNEISNDFSNVITLEEFSSDTRGSFRETVDDSNGILKDISYDLQSISGYPISGSLVISKMRSTVESYLDYLREMQGLISKGRQDEIDDINDLDELRRLNDELSESYNELLIADQTKIIEASIPSEFFDIVGDLEKIVEAYLEDREEQGKADEKLFSEVGSIVSKFMQAFINKDAGSMEAYFTESAVSVFNPGVLEDPTEIKEYSVTSKNKINKEKIEMRVEITKETPDQSTITERRKFVLIKENNLWLIDSWSAF
ncbi:MAG: hypothetical protein U9M89_01790 [Patescibacteria group bacterium]|nr:hypothetical protein [Patescibacteria group bacterium]